MIELLEVVANDEWSMVFYYILVLVLLIGLFIAYLQVFVKPLTKKRPLKENIIYQHSEDIIEESSKDYKKKTGKKK